MDVIGEEIKNYTYIVSKWKLKFKNTISGIKYSLDKIRMSDLEDSSKDIT